MSAPVASLLVPPEPDLLAQERVHSAIFKDGDRTLEDESRFPVTCQVRIVQDRAKGWNLVSLDCHGQEKTIGGDEYYVAYTAASTLQRKDVHPYTAVAQVEDCQDGTYRLEFSATPTCTLPQSASMEQGGRLTIYFQYSCGIGAMPSPTKREWTNGAYTHRCHYVDLEQGPPIRPFAPPSESIDLSRFDLVVAFGDSTMEQLVRQRPNKKGKYFFRNNLSYGEKVAFSLNTQTVPKFLELLEQGSGRHLRDEDERFPRRAVLLGSCLWDVLDSKDELQGAAYQDHQEAIRIYINAVRQRYPDVTILWKSPTAVHIHVVDLERLVVSKMGEAALFGIERLRYMSASRSKHIYQIQKRILQEEGIPFLDIYQATYLSADWLFPSDGRHYRPDLNRLMLSWFYPKVKDQSNFEVTCDDDGKLMLTIAKPYSRDPTQQSDITS